MAIIYEYFPWLICKAQIKHDLVIKFMLLVILGYSKEYSARQG